MRKQLIETLENMFYEVEQSSLRGELTAEVFKDHVEDAADEIEELTNG